MQTPKSMVGTIRAARRSICRRCHVAGTVPRRACPWGVIHLRDVRVLELAGSVAAAYCGRMFAATGADVVLAEPAEGAPTRRLGPWITNVAGERVSTTHEYLDAGKRS